MEFWSLLSVASMPVVKLMLVALVGGFLASSKFNILTSDSRRDMNKIVFIVFFPALSFASLATTVTLNEIISLWFMPVNIGITFLIGGILGWSAVKILKLEPRLENLVIACCSTGNLGTLILIIIPAICNEDGNPFGEANTCNVEGLSYASLSMALGNIFIWTYTYSLMKNSADQYDRIHPINGSSEIIHRNPDARREDTILIGNYDEAYGFRESLLRLPSLSSREDAEQPRVMLRCSTSFKLKMVNFCDMVKESFLESLKELLSPPTIASIGGFIVGVVPWLKALIVGETAPLRIVQDSITLLGDGTIPCATLVLGGNLTQGLRNSAVKPSAIVAVICVRYLMLPFFGVGVVTAAGHLGFLPPSPLFSYVLLLQFVVPPGMSIGTMAQLFEVSREECSVIFLWTYLVASLSLTIWSMVFMWILS